MQKSVRQLCNLHDVNAAAQSRSRVVGRHGPHCQCASYNCGLAAGTRDAIQEQLRLGQELRRKVEAPGSASGDDSDGDDSATDASDEEDGAQEDLSKPSRKAVAKAKAAAMDILQSGSPFTCRMPCQQHNCA